MHGVIAAIRLISADAEALAGFYERALGFIRAPAASATDPFGVRLSRLIALRLGSERLEIAEPENPAAGAGSAMPDTSFQHFAMVAPAMEHAMARLAGEAGWTAITRGAPQRLPAESGGVTAFKFRDPEGHPLEFIAFPSGATPGRWRGRAGVLVGIDHTAVVVGDTARSVAHYAALGFRQTGATLNRGPEQAALDGLSAPEVEVTALALPGAPPPHLELLCYRGQPATCAGISDRSVLATRTILAGGDAPLPDRDGHRWIVPAEVVRAAERRAAR